MAAQKQTKTLKQSLLTIPVFAVMLPLWFSLTQRFPVLTLCWVPLGVGILCAERWGSSFVPGYFAGNLVGAWGVAVSGPRAWAFAAGQALSVWWMRNGIRVLPPAASPPPAVLASGRTNPLRWLPAMAMVDGSLLAWSGPWGHVSSLGWGILLAGPLSLLPFLLWKGWRHSRQIALVLRRFESERTALVQLLPEALFLLDREGNRVEEAESVAALPPAGVGERAFLGEACRPQRQALLRQAWASSEPIEQTLTVAGPDGPLNLEVRLLPRDNLACLVQVRDLTGELTERAARAAGARREAALRVLMPGQALWLDAAGVVLERLALSGENTARPAMLHQPLSLQLVEADRASFDEARRGVGLDREPRLIEARLAGTDSPAWVTLRVHACPGEAGCLVLVTGCSQEHLARQAAAETHRLLHLVSGNMADIVSVHDEDGTCRFISPSVEPLLGYSAEELAALPPQNWVPPAEYARLAPLIARFLAEGGPAPLRLEVQLCTKDRQALWLETEIRRLPSEAGTFSLLTVSRDITARKNTGVQLQISDMLVQNMKESMMVLDLDGYLVWANPAFLALTGYVLEEVQGRTASDLLGSAYTSRERLKDRQRALETESRWQGELLTRRKDGSHFSGGYRCSVVHDAGGAPLYHLSLITDLSERQERDELIWKLSTHDTLTGLPNRAFFVDMLTHACARARRESGRLAVLTVQVSRFKALFDALGQEAGEALLAAVSERLIAGTDDYSVLAQLRQGEFGLLVERDATLAEVSSRAAQLNKLFEQPFPVQGQPVYLQVNLGIAVCPDHAATAEQLLACAATAMAEAAQQGPTVYRFYQPRMASREDDRHIRLESAFREALQGPHLQLHYQPQLSLGSGRLTGFEALSRWQDPVLGAVSPSVFVPLAESSGLIVPFGTRTLREALLQQARWQTQGLPVVRVSVNLSLQQVHSPYLMSLISALLEETGVSPELLELEITESTALLDANSTLSVMKQIRDMGVGFALDDFGTGYSNLANLHKFPLTTVKIDRAFVAELGTVKGDVLCKAAIGLGRALGLRTVAEGVETEPQRQLLQDFGCDEYQGFLYSPAVSEQEARAWLV